LPLLYFGNIAAQFHKVKESIMRRCYRGVALVLGAILFTSSAFSNSCSFATLEVYAAEDTLSENNVADEMVKITRKVKLSENVTVTETVNGADNLDPDKFADQNGILTGEENVETEIPADESEPAPTEVEAEDYKNRIRLKLKEYNVLLRIVEAEAGGEDITGKMLVANVIMNRINSRRFPNTVTEVVYQKSHSGRAQFSPTVDGRMDSVTVSEDTVEAVDRVLSGEDSSNGALYFRSVRAEQAWHDGALRRVLEHGNHIFYTI
jgi:N-acetylmuramoyl-L-alanine amidase